MVPTLHYLALALVLSLQQASVEVVDAPPWYVGQGIRLRVRHRGEPNAAIEPRAIDPSLASIYPLQPEEPGSSGERDFLVVPRKAGRLIVPPFSIARGEAPKSTRATELSVRPVPELGRSSAYLGGVGALEIAAIIDANRVTVGKSVTLSITIKGLGAIGSVHASRLVEEAFHDLPVDVRRVNDTLQVEPPVRTLVLRLRAREPGRFVLPTIAISTFDPTSKRFMTHRTRSIALFVEPVESFIPTSPAHPGSTRGGVWWSIAALCGAVVTGIAAALLVFRKNRSRPVPDPDVRGMARAAIDDLNNLSTTVTRAAERIDHHILSITACLDRERAAANAPSDLDPALAHRLGALRGRCEWYAYSRAGRAAGSGTHSNGQDRALIKEAVALFELLANAKS